MTRPQTRAVLVPPTHQPSADGQTVQRSPWEVGGQHRKRRRRLLTGLTAVSLAIVTMFGLPTGREAVTVWVLALLFCVVGGDRSAWGRAVLKDWLPLLAALFAYDRLRGIADSAAGRTIWQPQITVDRFLFADGVPTVWLQDRLLRTSPSWYDLAIVPIYLSHFIAPLAVAAGLWARSYERFVQYVKVLLTLTATGLLTYALLPAAPPWLASQTAGPGGQPYLPPVERVVSRTLLDSGIPTIHNAVQRGEAYANPVAALPSLHAAVPMLILITFWPVVRRTVRTLLVTYVLLMAFTLVYAGEHYVADVLLGWGYAGVASLAVRWLTRRPHRRRARPWAPWPRRRSPARTFQIAPTQPTAAHDRTRT